MSPWNEPGSASARRWTSAAVSPGGCVGHGTSGRAAGILAAARPLAANRPSGRPALPPAGPCNAERSSVEKHDLPDRRVEHRAVGRRRTKRDRAVKRALRRGTGRRASAGMVAGTDRRDGSGAYPRRSARHGTTPRQSPRTHGARRVRPKWAPRGSTVSVRRGTRARATAVVAGPAEPARAPGPRARSSIHHDRRPRTVPPGRRGALDQPRRAPIRPSSWPHSPIQVVGEPPPGAARASASGAMTLSTPISRTPRRMKGATVAGKSMPCARPHAATTPRYRVCAQALASVWLPTVSTTRGPALLLKGLAGLRQRGAVDDLGGAQSPAGSRTRRPSGRGHDAVAAGRAAGRWRCRPRRPRRPSRARRRGRAGHPAASSAITHSMAV